MTLFTLPWREGRSRAARAGWSDLSTRALLDVERPSPHPVTHFATLHVSRPSPPGEGKSPRRIILICNSGLRHPTPR
ncbi:hypothetical protein EAS62_36650 [Bradyrhizobium zhanjiangense]|uniref:Uncharacterized protein n=1 Tax=Bradyrhizobium zhanjiangense TaxID=1325107 RepID=A0ABY0D9P4_9BRAD|nr:hypothetical protein EAS62_36650 [Bradyrhizobium zhanjiangense]